MDHFKYLAGPEGLISVDEKYAYVPVWRWLRWDVTKYVDSPASGEVGGLIIVNIENPAAPFVLDGRGLNWCTGQADEVCGYIYCSDLRGSTLSIINATTLP